MFLADRSAPASGPRAPAAADIDPATGRGRPSFLRAEYLFKTASAQLDPHQQGWTLHQLRHSALQHVAQAGRTAPELQAKSRHPHPASLGRYVRLGEETSARVTAEADPSSAAASAELKPQPDDLTRSRDRPHPQRLIVVGIELNPVASRT
ncbi:hypothetical protein ACTMTI_54085 [Nonomuraea sp. H19]|uniref:hypothetical protein n=1 Tax=Nonomuraea sp. H19 TaxID=3452206 RepID=UPI003F8C88D7